MSKNDCVPFNVILENCLSNAPASESHDPAKKELWLTVDY